MDLAYFRILINESLNKDLDIVPEEDLIIALYSKSVSYGGYIYPLPVTYHITTYWNTIFKLGYNLYGRICHNLS